MEAGGGGLQRTTMEVNATWTVRAGIQDFLAVSKVEGKCAEHQMLLRTEYRLDCNYLYGYHVGSTVHFTFCFTVGDGERGRKGTGMC